MVQRAAGRQYMQHDGARGRQIVDDLEELQLIGDVLRGAEVRDDVIAADELSRHLVVVQVERNAAGRSVDVDEDVGR